MIIIIIIIISRPWNNDSASLARTGTDRVNESTCGIRGCMRFVHSSAARWYLCSTGRRKKRKACHLSEKDVIAGFPVKQGSAETLIT